METSSVSPDLEPMDVPCSTDADMPACFYCAGCDLPFCEECIGRKEEGRIYCLQCTLAEEGRRERSLHKPAPAKGKGRQWAYGILGSLAAAIVCFNLYILFTGRPTSSAEQAVRPNMTPQLSEIAECRHRLEFIAEQARQYQEDIGRPPTELADVQFMAENPSMLREPVTRASYGLKYAQDKGIIVQCPNPRAHGLKALYARPGKPAMMVYLRSKRVGQ